MSIRDKKKLSENNVFHIKIGANTEVTYFLCKKLNLNDPAFRKVLEQ